ncbi:hypothetical protein D9M69_477760 [compost metagenome]
MRQQVLDAARAAREVQVHERPHHGPAQAGAVRDGGVDVGHARHAFVDEVKRLAPQGSLQPVRDVAFHLALHVDRPLADGRIERHRAGDDLGRGLRTADHFDQRDQVRRIERMPQHHALRMYAARLHAADRQARRTRREDGLGRCRRVHAAEQVDLEIHALGAVLLHEVGHGHGVFQAVVKAQAIDRSALGQAEALQRRPVLRHGGTQPVFGAGRGVGRVHVEPVREEVRGPARADHAGADDGDALHVGGEVHADFHRAQRLSVLVVHAASPGMFSITL